MPNHDRRSRRSHARVGGVVMQGALVGILGVAVVGSTLAVGLRPSGYAFLDPVIDVETLIRRNYVTQPDLDAMQTGAIQGMLEVLDDPYTVYVPPTDSQEFTKALTGEYVGIGARILVREGWLTIVSPLEGSPALRAGLQPDDRVKAIDGTSTYGETTDFAIDRLQGEPGTTVTLTVERDGQELEIIVERAQVKTRSVTGFHRDPSDEGNWLYMVDPSEKIAYARLTQFTPRCDEELRAALESFDAHVPGAINGLILDLRWNPGGGLDEAVGIADMFLDSGDVVITRGRAFPEETRSAGGRDTLPDFPVLVMINGESASASEIVAGALVENGRAAALGTRTFGKGSVQSLQRLARSGGAQLKFTTQRYYLPSGRSIHRDSDSTEWGVDPSPGLYVPLTDEQAIALLRERNEQEVIRTDDAAAAADAEGRWDDPDWVVEKLNDPQLGKALEAVRGKIATGDWPTVGLPGMGGDEIALEELSQAMVRRERLLRELSRLADRMRELEVVAAGAEATPARDLWSDDIDIEGGVVEIRDAEGNVTATLRITGPDLERWLIDADVEPAEGPGS